MGFTILIVLRRGIILCKAQGKGCGFPGPKSGTWGTRPVESVEEELCMTFQVAMVGSDGIIAGSDRKIGVRDTHSGESLNDAGPWQFSSATKILTSADKEVICLFAGTFRSRTLARQICEEADPIKGELAWETWLHDCATSQGGFVASGDEVIVIRKKVLDRFVHVIPGQTGSAHDNEGFLCTGTRLTARYLPYRFYKPLPVAALRDLVLLTLDSARRERPSEIGGGWNLLEISSTGVVPTEYSEEDQRIVAVRERFDRAAKSAILAINS